MTTMIEVQICEKEGVVALSMTHPHEEEELMQEARYRIRERARKDGITNDEDMDDDKTTRYSIDKIDIFDEIIHDWLQQPSMRNKIRIVDQL
jgi:hypothetical protein